MCGSRQASEQEQAIEFALWRGMVLVLFPGLAFAIGLIAFVILARPPVSTLYGCYRLDASPLIRVKPGLISAESSEISPIRMTIEKGKEGYVISADSGISFETGRAGAKRVITDYPTGELIPVYISQNRPPSLGIISDGELIKVPKIACSGLKNWLLPAGLYSAQCDHLWAFADRSLRAIADRQWERHDVVDLRRSAFGEDRYQAGLASRGGHGRL